MSFRFTADYLSEPIEVVSIHFDGKCIQGDQRPISFYTVYDLRLFSTNR